MGYCCSKSGGGLCSCCDSCCGSGKDGASDSGNRQRRLPESVPTHDLTAHKRPKVHLDTAMTTTTASFMTYALRNEHPTDLDRQVAKSVNPEPLRYVMLDDEKNLPPTPVTGNSGQPQVVRYSITDLPEQATKL